ncbi:hypothetical protein CK203_016533 [Vitis vinifera]|uniref:Uncharacterized protein n=1 Tax=Vitis vinifera TaxID=29760 RepID=A0A438J175_VITVI|nr:hypothetical protein CK203_016533 [Vitis vinifera]
MLLLVCRVVDLAYSPGSARLRARAAPSPAPAKPMARSRSAFSKPLVREAAAFAGQTNRKRRVLTRGRENNAHSHKALLHARGLSPQLQGRLLGRHRWQGLLLFPAILLLFTCSNYGSLMGFIDVFYSSPMLSLLYMLAPADPEPKCIGGLFQDGGGNVVLDFSMKSLQVGQMAA